MQKVCPIRAAVNGLLSLRLFKRTYVNTECDDRCAWEVYDGKGGRRCALAVIAENTNRQAQTQTDNLEVEW